MGLALAGSVTNEANPSSFLYVQSMPFYNIKVDDNDVVQMFIQTELKEEPIV